MWSHILKKRKTMQQDTKFMHKLQWYENKYPIIFLYGLLINQSWNYSNRYTYISARKEIYSVSKLLLFIETIQYSFILKERELVFILLGIACWLAILRYFGTQKKISVCDKRQNVCTLNWWSKHKILKDNTQGISRL
jgi:hypothetical protein